MDQRRNKQAVTVYDIALRAGVSPATVSRVLGGAVRVTAPRRAAVLEAARTLRYRPNLMAQDLASGRSQTVGLVLPDAVSSFWGSLVEGVETALRARGYHLLMATARGSDGEQRALDLLLRHQVDGLVLASGALTDEELAGIVGAVPFVTVCRGAIGGERSRIRVDNREGARAALEHLLGLGHTRIAHVAGPRAHGDAQARRQGYKAALRAAGLRYEPELVVESAFGMASGLAATARLLRARRAFTALFAGSDQIALGAMLALDRHGLRVPGDVSVVGFDDETFASYCRPPLTTVRQPTFAIGQAAVFSLLVRADGGEPPPLASFPTRLCIRASTGPRKRRRAPRRRSRSTA
jgi:LacI family transcriptional regulator, galactose operon repressor